MLLAILGIQLANLMLQQGGWDSCC